MTMQISSNPTRPETKPVGAGFAATYDNANIFQPNPPRRSPPIAIILIPQMPALSNPSNQGNISHHRSRYSHIHGDLDGGLG